MRPHRLLGSIVAASLLLSATLPAARAQTPATAPRSEAKLVVGTMRVPPFASRGDDGQWSGLAITLWTQVADKLHLEFEYREFDYDPDGLLDALANREIDLAVATLPMTPEGEVRFDFSHPYFAAGLGIAVRSDRPPGVAAMIAALPWAQILRTVAALLAALVVAGGLVWWVERRRNPAHFNPDPVKGVGDGVWWAAVTMTTTGYGDKAPITWRGRAIALIWMFTSIFCIAAFSATLASSFVVGQLKSGITGPADLPGARVGIVAGTAGARWAEAQGLKTQRFRFVIQASKALRRGDVDALIFERAILGHMIKQYAWTGLDILPQTLAVRDYALAFPHGSLHRETVNRAMLEVMQADEWQDEVRRHTGTQGD